MLLFPVTNNLHTVPFFTFGDDGYLIFCIPDIFLYNPNFEAEQDAFSILVADVKIALGSPFVPKFLDDVSVTYQFCSLSAFFFATISLYDSELGTVVNLKLVNGLLAAKTFPAGKPTTVTTANNIATFLK